MRFFYFVINTASLLKTNQAIELDFEEILRQVYKKLILPPKTEASLYFYVSHASKGLQVVLNEFKQHNIPFKVVVVDPKDFSEENADKAFRKVVTEYDEVTQVKAVPHDLLSRPQLNKMLEKMREKWDWAYICEIPPPKLGVSLA